VIDALWTAIVVGYCRCFDPTQGKDRLHAEQVFAGKPDGLIVHEKIWQLRNEHYAHDVNDIREVRVGVALDAHGTNLDILRIGSTWYHGMDQFQNLLNLVADAKAFVAAEIAGLIKELVDEVAAMTPEQRLALPPLEFGAPEGRARRRRNR
jgi:hypothetical protein